MQVVFGPGLMLTNALHCTLHCRLTPSEGVPPLALSLPPGGEVAVSFNHRPISLQVGRIDQGLNRKSAWMGHRWARTRRCRFESTNVNVKGPSRWTTSIRVIHLLAGPPSNS
jgi:hypothetical protein